MRTIQGCKGPNNRGLGPTYHNHDNATWALKPYYLGPWTFRDFKAAGFSLEAETDVSFMTGGYANCKY